MRATRPTWAEVSAGALRRNLARLKRRCGVDVMAVVKANAYGHGAVTVAKALGAGVRSLGVATLEEALELREAGRRGEVMVLGAVEPARLGDAAKAKVGVTVWNRLYLDDAARAARRHGPLDIHIKVDTGMARLGCGVDEVPGLLGDFAAGRWTGLRLSSGYTHLAMADEPKDPLSAGQVQALARLPWPPGLRLHAANSAAALRYPWARFSQVRSGIFLYGCATHRLHPLARRQEPALSLYSTVVRVARLRKGQGVSYGHTFKAPRAMNLATLCCGYADGVPRALSNRGQIAIRGRLCRVVGRVTMDLMMVDLGPLKGIRPGERAKLLGEAKGPLSAQGWAEATGTLAYEVLCGIGARVPRLAVP